MNLPPNDVYVTLSGGPGGNQVVKYAGEHAWIYDLTGPDGKAWRCWWTPDEDKIRLGQDHTAKFHCPWH